MSHPPPERCRECGMEQLPNIHVAVHEEWCRRGNAMKLESERALQHLKAVRTILSFFHESWMNEWDKAEFDRELLKYSGKTMADWDADIEKGVRLGISVEEQIEISKRLILDMKANPQ